jgi:TRAP-type mannitol/chloroaromatic compound transport system substrate-binding protein
MPSTFGRNIEITYGGAQLFVNAVREMTDGNFDIQWFGPGEVVPALNVIPAVGDGTVEMGQSATFYHIGQDPTFQFGSGLPFGMNIRGHAAWWRHGGGDDMTNEFLKTHKVHAVLAGDTGAQMAGWFRKEIKSAADLRGLKMRIAGMAGHIVAKAGVVPQQIAPGDIYSALERGIVDATKFTSPADDEKLGFFKVAPYYYYPGWNDAGVATHIFINLEKWNELPKSYQQIIRSAGLSSYQYMVSRYDAENPGALRRVVAQGAKIRRLPDDVIAELYKAARAHYSDLSNKNENFKRFYESYDAFVQNHYLWWQIAELGFDTMQVKLRVPR